MENNSNSINKDKNNEKTALNKILIRVEIGIITIACLNMATIIGFVSLFNVPEDIASAFILYSVYTFIALAIIALKLEQIAGKYKCKACGHLHMPSYTKVLVAPHIGFARYLKCPECGKRTLNKKILNE